MCHLKLPTRSWKILQYLERLQNLFFVTFPVACRRLVCLQCNLPFSPIAHVVPFHTEIQVGIKMKTLLIQMQFLKENLTLDRNDIRLFNTIMCCHWFGVCTINLVQAGATGITDINKYVYVIVQLSIECKSRGSFISISDLKIKHAARVIWWFELFIKRHSLLRVHDNNLLLNSPILTSLLWIELKTPKIPLYVFCKIPVIKSVFSLICTWYFIQKTCSPSAARWLEFHAERFWVSWQGPPRGYHGATWVTHCCDRGNKYISSLSLLYPQNAGVSKQRIYH